MDKAGVIKPDGVGSVHVLRHSGVIQRLKRAGNPKAVQDQLRHKSALMTSRYNSNGTGNRACKVEDKASSRVVIVFIPVRR